MRPQIASITAVHGNRGACCHYYMQMCIPFQAGFCRAEVSGQGEWSASPGSRTTGREPAWDRLHTLTAKDGVMAHGATKQLSCASPTAGRQPTRCSLPTNASSPSPEHFGAVYDGAKW